MLTIKTKKIIGWISVFISILTACFWAFWGIIENFHEGWYYASFLKNIGLMFIQYLSPVIITIALTLIAIRHNKIGALSFIIIGGILSFLVNNAIISIPFIFLGVLYWFSDFSHKKWKYRLSLLLPLITLIIMGIEPVIRVSGRINDENFGIRTIEQNDVALVWSPQGLGWPDDGTDWFKADSICKYLTEDGLSIASQPQNIWRLPTVEEAVKSMQRHGVNCKGMLNSKGEPKYEVDPDKETPLWNPNSKVIYWWTKTEIDKNNAFIIVYDGKIWKRRKSFGPNYLGFRAVKEIATASNVYKSLDNRKLIQKEEAP